LTVLSDIWSAFISDGSTRIFYRANTGLIFAIVTSRIIERIGSTKHQAKLWRM
jgi:hypothetical protein